MRSAILVLVVLLILTAASCTTQVETRTPAPTLPPPSATATSAPSVLLAPTPDRLTLWLPDWMVLVDSPATTMYQEAIAGFETANGIRIDIVPKLPRGDGGLLDFLTAAYPVAPGILPDVIALPLTDVETAAAKGWLQPLDALLDPAIQEDLFPYAKQIARTDKGRLAIPFVNEFEHLAFLPSALTEPPVDWAIVLEARATYAFAAGGSETVLPDAVLLHYLSVLGPESNPRNERALRELLTFYAAMQKAQQINAGASEADVSADTWLEALRGSAMMAHTTSTLWLSERDRTTVLRFGPAPTADGQPRYLVRGWAYAILTADPKRQALAAQLLNGLLAPANLAPWTLAARRLPASPLTLARWPADAYTIFATEALSNAVRPPTWTTDLTLTRALHRAVLDVLAGRSDIDAAVRSAVASW